MDRTSSKCARNSVRMLWNALKRIKMPKKCLIWVIMNLIALRYSNSDLITFDYCWSGEFLRLFSNWNEFFFDVYYLIYSVDYQFHFFYIFQVLTIRIDLWPDRSRAREVFKADKRIYRKLEKKIHTETNRMNDVAWFKITSFYSKWWFLEHFIFSFVRLW